MGDSVVVVVSSSVAVEKRREDEVLMEKRAGLIAAIAEPERECPLMLLLLPPLPNKVEWLEIAAIRRALLALLVMLPSDLLDTDDTDVDDGDAGRKASADVLHHDVDVDRMVAIMMTMLPPIFMTADETEGKEGRVQIRYGYL